MKGTPKDFAPLIEVGLDEKTGNMLVTGTAGKCQLAFAITEDGFREPGSLKLFVSMFAELRMRLWDGVQGQAAHPVADAIAAMRTGAPHIGGDRY